MMDQEITGLINQAIRQQASDLHLIAGNYPALRIDNEIVFIEDERLIDKTQLQGCLDYFLNDQQKSILEKNKNVSVSRDFEKGLRGRINISYQKGLPAVYVRFIPLKIRTLEDLGFPPMVRKILQSGRGLVLITGPFNSGRSTTAAALLNDINQKEKKYIITIEKPIEYIFEGNKSMIEQKEVGIDVIDYQSALKSIGEKDVDVLYIDRTEEPAEIQEVLEIARGNALVISTFNADSSFAALEEIIYGFGPDKRAGIQKILSESLKLIIAQRLIPKIGGGLVLAYEILFANRAIKLLINEGNLSQVNNILQTSREEGMVSLDHSLAALVKSNQVSREDALKEALNQEALEGLLR